jgi:glycine cleavage system H protein
MQHHPAELRYSSSHEWVRVEGDLARIGITDYAQSELGDVVYLDLPEVGRTLKTGDIFGAVESVKAISDLYSPLNGEVVETNEDLPSHPETINSSPYEKGWMLVIRMSDSSEPEGLMDAATYEESLRGGGA